MMSIIQIFTFKSRPASRTSAPASNTSGVVHLRRSLERALFATGSTAPQAICIPFTILVCTSTAYNAFCFVVVLGTLQGARTALQRVRWG